MWLIRGYLASMEWQPREGLYLASVPALPGCSGRGESRAEALRDLSRAIDRHLAAARPAAPGATAGTDDDRVDPARGRRKR